METLVLLDRAVAALKEEYRKMIHYEWLFSMPRVDSAQCLLNLIIYTYIYTVYILVGQTASIRATVY